MDKVNWTLAVDVVLALLVLWKLLQGRRDGMVRKLGGLAALVGAVLGAVILAKGKQREAGK